jgi:hypothetical protein
LVVTSIAINNINLGINNKNNNTKNLVETESSESAAMTTVRGKHIVIGDALWRNLADDEAIAADISTIANGRNGDWENLYL